MSDPHAHATGHAQSELDADEPRTPMWLPLLGGSLFLAAAIFALATSSNEPAANEGESPKAAANEAPPSEAAPAPAPAPSPRINVRRVPDDQIQRVAPAAPMPGMNPGAPGNPAAPRMVLPPPTDAARRVPPARPVPAPAPAPAE